MRRGALSTATNRAWGPAGWPVGAWKARPKGSAHREEAEDEQKRNLAAAVGHGKQEFHVWVSLLVFRCAGRVVVARSVLDATGVPNACRGGHRCALVRETCFSRNTTVLGRGA